MKQRQDLERAPAHILVRLGRGLLQRPPAAAGMGNDLERPGLVLAPDREISPHAKGVGPLDQLFFAAASTSVTVTAPPCRRGRTTAPVVHQVRLFCQLRPASCRVRQIV